MSRPDTLEPAAHRLLFKLLEGSAVHQLQAREISVPDLASTIAELERFDLAFEIEERSFLTTFGVPGVAYRLADHSRAAAELLAAEQGPPALTDHAAKLLEIFVDGKAVTPIAAGLAGVGIAGLGGEDVPRAIAELERAGLAIACERPRMRDGCGLSAWPRYTINGNLEPARALLAANTQ